MCSGIFFQFMEVHYVWMDESEVVLDSYVRILCYTISTLCFISYRLMYRLHDIQFNKAILNP